MSTPAASSWPAGQPGGHLSLLAAYAHDDPALTPVELIGFDPEVCAVASLYGMTDLAACCRHTSQDRGCRPDDPQPDWTALPVAALAGAARRRQRRPAQASVRHVRRLVRLARRRHPAAAARAAAPATVAPPVTPRRARCHRSRRNFARLFA
jgi:MYXO-CTERM domain-containing protein